MTCPILSANIHGKKHRVLSTNDAENSLMSYRKPATLLILIKMQIQHNQSVHSYLFARFKCDNELANPFSNISIYVHKYLKQNMKT